METKQNKISYHNIVEIGLFSTILENFNKDLILTEIHNYKKTYPESVGKSNIGSWQSDSNIQKHPSFKNLCKQIQDEFYEITKDPSKIIDSMWVNISSYRHHNTIHSHNVDTYPYKKYSGVMYLKVPKDSGRLVIVNPLNLNYQMPITPKEGQVIFFPSVVPHFVEINNSQEDRISIAFNFTE